ncbi:hypothetical protein IFR05_009223 [Cadophora sp. M221]|nr:hypothetical protein IFR05_009223 [Cadophora sp. M221]
MAWDIYFRSGAVHDLVLAIQMSSTSPQDDGNSPPNPSRRDSIIKRRTEPPAHKHHPGSSFPPSEGANSGHAERSQRPVSRPLFNLPPNGSAARELLDKSSSEEEEKETTESFVKLAEKDEEGRARMRAQKRLLQDIETEIQGMRDLNRLQSNDRFGNASREVGDMRLLPRLRGPPKTLACHSFSAGVRGDHVPGEPPIFRPRAPLPPPINRQLDAPSGSVQAPPNVQKLPAHRNSLPESLGYKGGSHTSLYTPSPDSRPVMMAPRWENEVQSEELADGGIGEAGPAKPRSQSIGAAPRENLNRVRLSMPSSSMTSALPPSGRTFCKKEGEIIRDLLALSKRFDVIKVHLFDYEFNGASQGDFGSLWIKFVENAWDLLSFEMPPPSTLDLRNRVRKLESDLGEANKRIGVFETNQKEVMAYVSREKRLAKERAVRDERNMKRAREIDMEVRARGGSWMGWLMGR